jgi:hypothetical protein
MSAGTAPVAGALPGRITAADLETQMIHVLIAYHRHGLFRPGGSILGPKSLDHHRHHERIVSIPSMPVSGSREIVRPSATAG